jgi:intracellular multiplication protein IcmE
LKAAGFSAAELKAAKFLASDLKEAGFTLMQLKQARFKVHFARSEHRRRSGPPFRLPTPDARTPHASAPVCCGQASEVRQANYPASDPIAVGYTFAELKEGGYPAAELLRACTAASRTLPAIALLCFSHVWTRALLAMQAAGYSAAELVALRYTLAEICAGGYAFRDLLDLGIELSDLIVAGFTLSAAELSLLEPEPPSVGSNLSLESTKSTFWGGQPTVSVRLRLQVHHGPTEVQ